MEQDKEQETTTFIPVTARLDRLDRVLELLEEKHSLSRRNVSADESNKKCKTVSSVLEEVQHKGTLLDRLALLEKRVLELSLELDQGNTSKSSSSTLSNPPIQAQERTSADGFEREMKAQHESRGTKKMSRKWWPWLPRLRC